MSVNILTLSKIEETLTTAATALYGLEVGRRYQFNGIRSVP
jgi:hypothetical protein